MARYVTLMGEVRNAHTEFFGKRKENGLVEFLRRRLMLN